MLGAIYGWFLKVGVTGSAALSGVLLLWTGFVISLPEQAMETIYRMRLCMVLIPTGGILLSMLLMACYPLTASRVETIKQELARRRQDR